MPASTHLPQGVHVFERGWLSSNSVLLQDAEQTVLVDSGYHTHAPLLLDLVHQQLQGRQLDLLLNTHLHSDHCGGNAALAARYPALQTWIAPGQAQAVEQLHLHLLTSTLSVSNPTNNHRFKRTS